MLGLVKSPLPGIAFRERDFLTDEQLFTFQPAKPNLFGWYLREFENALLDAELVARDLMGCGWLSLLPRLKRS